jgi:adenylate cyclase
MKRLFRSFLSLNPKSIAFYNTLIMLILFYFGVPLLDMVELKSFDLRFLSRGMKKGAPEVVLAVIDEKSLDTIGKWPWPRAEFGKLVDYLSEDGAKVIGFDVGFYEPDKNNRLELLNELDKRITSLRISSPQLEEFIEKSKRSADNDIILADSLRNSKTTVVLGHFFHMGTASLGIELKKDRIEERLDRISNSIYPVVKAEEPGLEIGRFIPEFTAYTPESNLAVLSEAAESSGYFNMVPDYDGIVRSTPLVIKCGRDIYAPMAIMAVWHFLDRPQLMIDVAVYGIKGVRLGERFIPTAENGTMLINYRGPEKTYPHYSISDILHGNLPEGTFENKIVIVGATAVGLGDIRNTPVSSSGEYPGMEVHANVIDNILNKNFLHKPQWTTIYDALLIILMGFLVGILAPRLGAIRGIIFIVVLFALHILGVNWLFSSQGISVNMVYPLITMFIVYLFLTMYHYLIEEKNKRFLHSTFSSYLSPELIEEMVSNKTMPELGGEARTITAYFTDIQSFSVFSEKLTATQLVELLNEYLSVMTDILIRERGTLDKYEGDAIVAFLGAPMQLPDHPLRACRVAVKMQGSLLELREKWKQEKQLPDEPERNTKSLPATEWAQGDKWPVVVHDMKMRIGVNSGEIVVGNMGSSMRMNYTMMGDSVNLAARLEEGAKQYGIYTAVSEYTLNLKYTNEQGQTERAMDNVEARFIDKITVVGKSEPVKIYELCAMKGGLSDQEKKLFNLFNKGIQHYQKMEWDEALLYFREALKHERIPDGKTTPSEIYIKRCEMYKEKPPVASGERWDGVFRMIQK